MSIKKNLQFRILYKKRKRKINFPNSCKYQIVANISVTIILNLPKSTIPFRSLERVFHLVQHGCDSNTNQMTKSIRPCSIVSSNRKKKKREKKKGEKKSDILNRFHSSRCWLRACREALEIAINPGTRGLSNHCDA